MARLILDNSPPEATFCNGPGGTPGVGTDPNVRAVTAKRRGNQRFVMPDVKFELPPFHAQFLHQGGNRFVQFCRPGLTALAQVFRRCPEPDKFRFQPGIQFIEPGFQ